MNKIFFALHQQYDNFKLQVNFPRYLAFSSSLDWAKQWSTIQNSWLRSIQNIVLSSIMISNMLFQKKESVMIKCGVRNVFMLRSPQKEEEEDVISILTSLTCILLDPFYRTFKGFQILIEKEWLAFGYNFASSFNEEQISESGEPADRWPVTFIQFLDSVWQIWSCVPSAFEFSESLLVFVLEQALFGRFGTFLFSGFDDPENHRL